MMMSLPFKKNKKFLLNLPPRSRKEGYLMTKKTTFQNKTKSPSPRLLLNQNQDYSMKRMTSLLRKPQNQFPPPLLRNLKYHYLRRKKRRSQQSKKSQNRCTLIH